MKNQFLFFLYLLMFGLSCAPSLSPWIAIEDPSKPQGNGNIVALISPDATPEELTQISEICEIDSTFRGIIFRNTRGVSRVIKQINSSSLWIAKMYIYLNWRGDIVKAEIIPEESNVKDGSMRKAILKTMMGYKFNALPAPASLQRKTFTLSYQGSTQIPW